VSMSHSEQPDNITGSTAFPALRLGWESTVVVRKKRQIGNVLNKTNGDHSLLI